MIDGDISVEGDGGPITLTPFDVVHGNIDSKGFRIGALKDLDVWIVDALRRTPHPTHSHLENTLAWIARAAPKRGVLTNMHNDLDYDVVAAETPDNITPAFDMMKITQP